MYFLVNTSAPKQLDVAISNMSHHVEVLSYISCDLDSKVKVKG